MSIVSRDVLGMDVHLDTSLCVTTRPESASNEHAVFRSGLWNHEGAK
jgi:hypothetical protein